MRVYTYPVCCNVCGGEGMATARGMSSQWYGAMLTHCDPSICADIIAARERKQQARIAALEQQVKEQTNGHADVAGGTRPSGE